MRSRGVLPLILLLVALTSGSLAGEIPGRLGSGRSLVEPGDGLSLYKEMYLLPYSYSDRYRKDQSEIVFQISAKFEVLSDRLYFGYSQKSFWQAYDFGNSSPFRETNYNPEVFFRLAPLLRNPGGFGAHVGFEHESNGQKGLVSRSWNRFYFAPYHAEDGLLLFAKVWFRVPEEAKENPESGRGDDNPDITDYRGNGELHLFLRVVGKQQVHLMVQGNPVEGHLGASLDYTVATPWDSDSFLAVHVWHGYGESLIDYDRSLTRVGLGVMVVR